MAEERIFGAVDRLKSGELVSDRLIIEGGQPLERHVRSQGAKNVALQVVCAASLADGKVILNNVPRIDDVESTLSILRSMGGEYQWLDANVLECDGRNMNIGEIDPKETLKTTASRYLITVGTRQKGLVVTGPSGGDRLGGGDRYSFSEETLGMYEKMGLGHFPYKPRDGIERQAFFPMVNPPSEMIQEERYFNPTVQAMLFHAKGPQGHEFVIHNPCIEPEILETIKLLNAMGADIEYKRTDGTEGPDNVIRIRSVANLDGTNFRIMSDPNALVSWSVMTLITDGHVTVGNIDPSSKVDAFLAILSRTNADFSYNLQDGSLELRPSLARLKPVDLETDFWPAQCHTDWQQILTPLLARLNGESYIDENVHPDRFTTHAALSKMGANIEKVCEPERLRRKAFKSGELANRPHTLKISGPCDFVPYSVHGPADIRGTTGLLAAMLSARGVSTLDGASQLQRGMEDVVGNLQSLGANVTRG